MTDKESIRKKLEHIVQRRLNLLNGEEFDLWLETKGFTNEIVDTIIDFLQEEPVSEELEEAAKNHAVERYRTTRDRELAEKCKWSFKAGAKWQKEKDYRDGIENDDFLTFSYMDGMEEGKKEMREQMIKNSIEVKVKSDKDGLFTTETWDEMNELLQKIGAKVGDKVYISIIKQEEE